MIEKRGLYGPFFVAQNSASAWQRNWRNSSISSLFTHRTPSLAPQRIVEYLRSIGRKAHSLRPPRQYLLLQAVLARLLLYLGTTESSQQQ
jgi:hypothetical protein